MNLDQQVISDGMAVFLAFANANNLGAPSKVSRMVSRLIYDGVSASWETSEGPKRAAFKCSNQYSAECDEVEKLVRKTIG